MRQLISSGSPWEAQIGYSRAVVVGDMIFVSATAGTGPDVYSQTASALAKLATVLEENGFALADVVSTRVSVSEFDKWADAGRAHGEVFGEIRPAFALVHALPFLDESILVEVELTAVREPATPAPVAATA